MLVPLPERKAFHLSSVKGAVVLEAGGGRDIAAGAESYVAGVAVVLASML